MVLGRACCPGAGCGSGRLCLRAFVLPTKGVSPPSSRGLGFRRNWGPRRIFLSWQFQELLAHGLALLQPGSSIDPEWLLSWDKWNDARDGCSVSSQRGDQLSFGGFDSALSPASWWTSRSSSPHSFCDYLNGPPAESWLCALEVSNLWEQPVFAQWVRFPEKPVVTSMCRHLGYSLDPVTVLAVSGYFW